MISVARGTILIIRADGTERVVESSGPIRRFLDVKKVLGYDALDWVPIGRALGNDLVMAVDDAGWESDLVDHGDGRLELVPKKARWPVNTMATALYHMLCEPGTTHAIVGDVAILHDE